MERTFRQVSGSLNIAIGTATTFTDGLRALETCSPQNLTEKALGSSVNTKSYWSWELLRQILLYTYVKCVRKCSKRLTLWYQLLHYAGSCLGMDSPEKVQQIALQRSSVYRGEFIAEIQMYSGEQFVWIDESGCDKRDSFLADLVMGLEVSDQSVIACYIVARECQP